MKLRQLPYVIGSAIMTFLRVALHWLRTGRIWSPTNEGEARYRICRGMGLHNECSAYHPEIDLCSECWCVMGKKTKLIEAKCPRDKWPVFYNDPGLEKDPK